MIGDAPEWLFGPGCNVAVKILERDERITSDAGLLLLREAIRRLSVIQWQPQQLVDPRWRDLIRYQMV